MSDTVSFPLSFSQQRLWFMQRFEPGSTAYNTGLAVRLTGSLDVDLLDLALREVQQRHEVLRTTYALEGDEPVQLIHPDSSFALTRIDVRHLPDHEREAEARRLASTELQTPFDLERGPVLRGSVIRLADNEVALVLVAHHIAADGWSFGVLTRELGTIYQARAGGRTPLLEELPIQYADYAAWQREWLTGTELATQLAYWREQLKNLPTADLPADRPRRRDPSVNGGSESIKLSEGCSSRLRALARELGASPFMAMLAAFKALLHRYTGQNDIVVGSPIATRQRSELEGLIGFFVNNLVLRTDCSANPTFRELLDRVRKVTLAAYAHQELPFERLVEDLQPERDPNRNPLFQISFAGQNAPFGGVAFGDVAVGDFPIQHMNTRFDLEVFVWERRGYFEVQFNYNADLFDKATIRRLAEHYSRLVEIVGTAPDRRLGDLSLLTASERQQMVVEWNQTAVPESPGENLASLFEAQAARTPDAVAVVAGSSEVSFGALDARANRLAGRLRGLGVGPDVLVAIYADRSIDMVVGLLGVTKAGGAYLPLDPTHPPDRTSFVLTDTGVSIVLTQPHLAPKLPTAANRTIMVLSSEEPLAAPTAPTVSTAAAPEHLAYVLYTSGSTGQPKGTLITHRGLTNYLIWARKAYRADEGHGSLVHSPFVFDLTVTSLLVPLVSGSRVVLLPEDQGVDGLANGVLDQSDATLLKLTPAHLQLLGHQLPTARAAGRTRALVVGGENLRWETLTFWQQHAVDTRIFNEYGPTETVVGCCVYEVPRGVGGTGSVPIGRPIANTQLYVLDQYQQLVPVGVRGELYIGGAGVARGYLNRPEMTAQRFIPDPFASTPDGRLYRTGDQVRWLPSGNLEFLGRSDLQVKIRGYRVELGEIESAIAALPEVRATVVILREDAPGDQRIIAYVVPTGSEPISLESIRRALGRTLPEYMWPAAVITLPEIPVNSNGKTDLKALPVPEGARAAGTAYLEPRDSTEADLVEIWRAVLRVNHVGVRDNFFSLGGHSLLATQLVSRIRERFGIDVPLRTVFDEPTVEGLALAIVQTRANESGSDEVERLLKELEGQG